MTVTLPLRNFFASTTKCRKFVDAFVHNNRAINVETNCIRLPPHRFRLLDRHLNLDRKVLAQLGSCLLEIKDKLRSKSFSHFITEIHPSARLLENYLLHSKITRDVLTAKKSNFTTHHKKVFPRRACFVDLNSYFSYKKLNKCVRQLYLPNALLR